MSKKKKTRTLIKVVRASDQDTQEVTKSELKHFLAKGYRMESEGAIEVKATVKKIKDEPKTETNDTKEGKTEEKSK